MTLDQSSHVSSVLWGGFANSMFGTTKVGARDVNKPFLGPASQEVRALETLLDFAGCRPLR